VRRGLAAGGYRVAVRTSRGALLHQRFVELGPGSGPLALRLRFVPLEGRVRLGPEPLRARLVLVDEAGGEPVRLESDDEGRFQGLLLAAPDAGETRLTVEARAQHPPVRRRLTGVPLTLPAGAAGAWLDLALPVFAVRGTVVSAEGAPRAGVEVALEGEAGGMRAAVTTDEAGRFDVAALRPGSYLAVARSAEGAVSEPTPLEVSDGVESELRLVLGRPARLAFRVVSSLGPVAEAAVQVWIAPGVPRGFTRTDPEGRFEVHLPPGTSEVGLTVAAPGHALKLTRLPADEGQTIRLEASGGRLLLDLQRAGRGPEGATAYVVRDGAIEAAGALGGWGRADAGPAGGPTAVDPIEPGVYALCLAGPDEVAALWRGALPSERCRTGRVEPGRSLTLSAP
jgi:hypothetical protein